jgi:hypothetical protein
MFSSQLAIPNPELKIIRSKCHSKPTSAYGDGIFLLKYSALS